MPAFVNSEILYYRTDLFSDPANQAAFKAKYGYALTPPTTWQQYADAAAFFTKDGMYGTAVKGAVETEYLATLSQAGEKNMVLDGKGDVTLGDAASLKALDYYTSLEKDAPSGESQIDWAAAQNLFNQGKTAMMLFWAHAYRQIPTNSTVYGKVGVAPMIGWPAGIAGVPGPFYLSVPKGSKKQQAAMNFLQFAYDHNALSAGTALGLVARISALRAYRTSPATRRTSRSSQRCRRGGHPVTAGDPEVAADRGHSIDSDAPESRPVGREQPTASQPGEAEDSIDRQMTSPIAGTAAGTTASVVPARLPRPRTRRNFNDRRFAMLLILPAALFLTVFVGWPLAHFVWNSLFEIDAINKTRSYVGMKNFSTALADPGFRSSAWRTLIYTAIVVFFEFFLGLVVALLLTALGQRSRIFRTIFMYPLMIAPIVAGRCGAFF